MDKILYREATTFKNLVCLNIAFLKGILNETPYHLGQIDEETIPLLSQLIQLNKKDFYQLVVNLELLVNLLALLTEFVIKKIKNHI